VKTGTSRRGAPSALLWGALVVLGWALLSILGSSGGAQADDGPRDDTGLLSSVGETVSGGADAVGDAVETATAPVAEVTDAVLTKTTDAAEPVADPAAVQTVSKPVEKAVQTVTDAPVVGKPATEVVQVVTSVVKQAAAPVVDTVRETSVSDVVRPVTDLLAETPVVGDALTELGVLELVDRSTGAVDTVVDGAESVIRVVAPVVDALEPQPPLIELPIADTPISAVISQIAAPSRSVASATPATRTGTLTVDFGAPSDAFTGLTGVWSALAGGPATDPHRLPADPRPSGAPTAFAGPAGSAASMQATANCSPAPPATGMSLRGLPAGSVLPPSPADGTDVTPD